MADNTELASGSGGDTIATDEIAGVKYPRSKIVIGADGTNDGDVSSANPLPVTGTITAVTSITNTVTVDLGANNDVTLATLPDTAAGDLAAMVVDLAAIEVLLGTIDADTSTLAGAVSGTEMQVDVVAALPAGDNNIGNVDIVTVPAPLNVVGGGTEAAALRVTLASDSTGVVSVDDNGGSLTIDGTVTANLSATDNAVLDTIASAVYADDAAFTLTTSKVFATGAIRDDSLSALTAVEGDVVPLRVSSTGALHVTGGGGGTEYTEDAATPATITGTATVMERDDALATLTPIEGDWAAMRCSAEGALWVQDANSDALLADTANMDTNLGTLAGAVSGTEMQVDVVASLPAGTNAIGKLAANSGVDIGDVDVTSIAAGTNTIGGTIAQQSTSTAYDGTTACTIKRSAGLAASGTHAMVAAVAAKKIRVLALFLKATSATVTNVYVANADNNILGDATNPIPLAVDADGDNDSGFVLPWNPGGWFETDTANEALNVVLSAAQDVIYALTYIEVD